VLKHDATECETGMSDVMTAVRGCDCLFVSQSHRILAKSRIKQARDERLEEGRESERRKEGDTCPQLRHCFSTDVPQYADVLLHDS
jgi:hypothetical protein